MWIVQEVARGNGVKLVFGSVSIDFDDFFLAYKCHLYHEVKTSGGSFGKTSNPKVAIQARAAVIDRDISMHQILQWSRLCEATKIVDRIYGLFGLLRLHEAGSSSTIQSKSLTVDYDRDIRSVFWDVIFACRVSITWVEDKASVNDDLSHFTKLFPLLAKSLNCSFSLQSLLCYLEAGKDPLLDRHITQLTRRFISFFQAIGKGIRTSDSASYWEPTRFSACLLRSERDHSNQGVGPLEAEMATLFLECAESNGVDEQGELHAALVAYSSQKTRILDQAGGLACLFIIKSIMLTRGTTVTETNWIFRFG